MPGLGPVLTALGQIPIERGAADERAMASATAALRAGAAVCVFPEGKLSLGRSLPARSGVGRLALGCPGATIVLCAVTGTTDFVRIPRRPRVGVSFVRPGAGQERDGQVPRELAAALLAEVRERARPVAAGRSPRV